MTFFERYRSMVVLLMALVALPAGAARDAAMKRGFDADAIFDTKAVDNINAFNGNLVASIPLGPEFTTSGSLRYRFTLVYNSNIWDYFGHSGVTREEGAGDLLEWYYRFYFYNEEDYDGPTTDPNADGVEAIPAQSFNAGVGWMVTLGQMRTTGSAGNGVPQVVYIGADGAEHSFYTSLHGSANAVQITGRDFYARDNSYIRMRVGTDATKREIHFPDGIIQRFACVSNCNKQNAQWVLKEMGDPYGNLLVITRSADGSPSDLRPALNKIWTWAYTEYFSRTTGYKSAGDPALVQVRQHTLKYRVTLADPNSPWVSEVRLEEIELPAYAGDNGSGASHTTAKYKLSYRDAQIFRDRHSSWWALSGTDPIAYPHVAGLVDRIRVSLLAAVDLPPNAGDEGTTNSSGRWEMRYFGDDCSDPAGPSCDAAGFFGERHWSPNGQTFRVNSVFGRLKHLRLPTQSGIRYEYGPRAYPNTNLCEGGGGPGAGKFTALFGVSRRQLTDRGGNDEGAPTLYFGNANTLRLRECKPLEFVSTIVHPPHVTPGLYAARPETARSMVTVTFHSVFADPLDPNCSATSPCWTTREHGLPVTHKKQKAVGGVIRGLSTSVYDCATSLFNAGPGLDDTVRRIVGHNLLAGETVTCGQPRRSTWVRYEDSAGPECSSNDLGYCAASNRREVSSLTEFYDDEFSTGCATYDGANCDPVHTVTNRSEFDGLGNFRRVVTDGNLLLRSVSASQRSDRRTRYTWYNPGVTYTPGAPFNAYPAIWILGLSKESYVAQDNEYNVRRTKFDANTGFLQATRTLKTKQQSQDQPGTAANDPLDLLSVSTREVGIDDRVTVTEAFYGGDAQSLPVDAQNPFAEPGGWVYAIQRIGRGGAIGSDVVEQVAYKQKCGATSDTILERTKVDAASGLVRAVTDEFGATTSYKYDLMGRIVRVKPPSEVAFDYDYPTLHNCVSGCERTIRMSRAGGEAAEWRYDDHGRQIEARRDMEDGNPKAAVSKTVTEYTMIGLKATVSTALAGGANSVDLVNTDYSYDIFGRPLKIVPPGKDAGTRAVLLDYQGIRETERTQEGASVGGYGTRGRITTAESRDAHGRLVAVDEDKGTSNVRTRYEYDLADRLVRVISPSGGNSDRVLVYDGRGLLTDETHPELAGSTVKWQAYDARGNAQRRVLSIPGKSGASPFDVSYIYNQSEQLVFVNQLSPARPLKSFTYVGGKIKQATRENYVVNPEATSEEVSFPVVTTFDYDTAGRVTGKTLNAGFAAPVGYQYDTFGRVQFIDYKAVSGCTGCGQVPVRQLSHGFSKSHLSSVSQTAPSARSYASNIHYHLNGKVSALPHGNGQTDITLIADDGLPRPARMYVQHSNGTVGWDSKDFVYDGAGTIEAIGPDKFRYDRRGRLAGMTVSGGSIGGVPDIEQVYGYDVAGNMINTTGDPDGGSTGGARVVVQSAGPVTTSVTTSIDVDPTTNRLLPSRALYDDAGNVIKLVDPRRYGFEMVMHHVRQDGVKQSWWDAENMLTRVEGSNLGEGGARILQFGRVFLYDAGNERVAVQDYNAAGVGGAPSVRELWTIRGVNNEVLRELERLRGTTVPWRWVKDNVYAGGRLIAAVLAGDVVRHYHADHLGSIRYVTDANGAFVDTRKYWAFGQEVNARPDDNRQKFTGHERDDDGSINGVGDLDYMHARYYAPMFGRFLSVDPKYGTAANPGSWNRFSYARNNPVVLVDPNGAEPELFVFEYGDVWIPSQFAERFEFTTGARMRHYEVSASRDRMYRTFNHAREADADDVVIHYGHGTLRGDSIVAQHGGWEKVSARTIGGEAHYPGRGDTPPGLIILAACNTGTMAQEVANRSGSPVLSIGRWGLVHEYREGALRAAQAFLAGATPQEAAAIGSTAFRTETDCTTPSTCSGVAIPHFTVTMPERQDR